MSKLAFQVQTVRDDVRSMVHATWPRAVKVLHTGVDKTLLGEMADHGLELVVGRYVFPESGNAAEVDARVSTLLAWADDALGWLRSRGVRVVLEVPYNEELQNGEALDRLNALTLKAMTRIAGRGYDIGIGVFSEGNPAGQGPPAPFVDWPRFYPSLRAANAMWRLTQTRAFLCLHEYSVPSLGVLDGWHNFRYRRVWARLPEDCRIPILVTESGIDGGIEGRRKTGWRGYGDAAAYATWLATTRAELEKDDYVWFSFVFGCGMYDEWASFDVRDEVDLRPAFAQGAVAPKWRPSAPQERGMTIDELKALARSIALSRGLDAEIILKQVGVESSWNPRAVSRSGAQGLMQLMPATAKSLGVTDPFDPRQNLDAGCRYVNLMLARYGGDYRKALAAYNWGPGNLDRLLDTKPANWESGISAQATSYLAKILGPPAAPAVDETRWPNGRVKASTAEYDALVWTPLFAAYRALAGGGNGALGDDEDAAAILEIKARNERRHGVVR